MEAKIVMTIVLRKSCTEDVKLLADAIANNIIYCDRYDCDGIQLTEEPNIEEVSWEVRNG